MPFLAAAIVAAGRRLPRPAVDAIAIGAAAASAVLSGALVVATRAGPSVEWMGGWAPRGEAALGIALAADPLGAGLGALCGVLAVAALVFSLRFFEDAERHFQAIVLLFQGALCGFGLTGDLFDLFVFFELMSVTAFALAGYKAEEPSAIQGSLEFAVTNSVAAFLILVGIALLYGRTGQLNLAAIGRALGPARDGLVLSAFTLLACGFLVKAAVVPFHFWLPDAHAVAPTPASALFSGVMVTAGLYAVVRLRAAAFGVPLAPVEGRVRAILVLAGVLAATVGALLCWAQRHLKRLLAYSTVAHVGVVLAMAGLATPSALGGAALYAAGHGLAKGALFLAAGIVLHRLRSVDEVALRGRGRADRAIGVLFALGAWALAGAPPFATFAGGADAERAAEELGYGWLRWPIAAAAVLTAGAVLRAAGRIFLGLGSREAEAPDAGGETTEAPETARSTGRVPAFMWAPVLTLLAASAALGIAPGAREAARDGSRRLLDGRAYAAAQLGGTTLPRATPAPPSPRDVSTAGHALAVAAAAFALAGGALARSRVPARWRRAPAAAWSAFIGPLRRLHGGCVGDDVTWLAAGVAVFGGLVALLLR